MSALTHLAAPAALSVLALGIGAAPAASEPPVNTDGTGHVHHVWLGDGTCLELDAVGWDPTTSGMHRGANASTASRGPWHGRCPS